MYYSQLKRHDTRTRGEEELPTCYDNTQWGVSGSRRGVGFFQPQRRCVPRMRQQARVRSDAAEMRLHAGDGDSRNRR